MCSSSNYVVALLISNDFQKRKEVDSWGWNLCRTESDGNHPPQTPRVYLLSQGCDQNNNNNNNSKQEVMEQNYWRWLNKINKWKQNSCNQPKGKLWSEFLISDVPEVLGWGTAQQCPHFVWLMLSNDAYRVGLHITVSVHLDDHVLFVQHCCAWIFIMSVCNKLSYRLPHWSLSPVDNQLFSFSVSSNPSIRHLSLFVV